MSAKYTIRFKNNTEETKKNLSFDEVLTFQASNMDKFGTFEVIEQTRVRQKSSIPLDPEQDKKQFMSLLTPLQKECIQLGSRVVKYSKEIGYYLQVVHKDTTFFSSEKLKKERQEAINRIVKNEVFETQEQIYLDVVFDNPHLKISREEFDIAFKNILK